MEAMLLVVSLLFIVKLRSCAEAMLEAAAKLVLSLHRACTHGRTALLLCSTLCCEFDSAERSSACWLQTPFLFVITSATADISSSSVVLQATTMWMRGVPGAVTCCNQVSPNIPESCYLHSACLPHVATLIPNIAEPSTDSQTLLGN